MYLCTKIKIALLWLIAYVEAYPHKDYKENDI